MADLKTTNIYGDAYINNKVGIATNAPATRLQIGQLSPTAATEGIQFGDDTSTRIYRIGAGSLILSSSISTVGTITSTYGTFSAPGISIGDGQYGFYITSGNLTYKSAAGGAHYWRNIANSANTLTLDNSGNLVAAGNISGANLSGTNTGDQSIGNGTITIAAGTGVSVGATNTFTTNQSGATTVTISNNGVTSNVAGTGISVSGATGAVTITNSGVTSAVAGTGVGVSAATGAVTFSIGQAVGTANSPTFVAVTTSTDGANHIMAGSTNAEGIRMTPASSTTYPVFLRSINPGSGGEASPWIYKEQATEWGIWHNNPVNSIDFTKAGSGGIVSNVGGGTNTVVVRVDMGTGYVQTIAGYRNSAGTTILDNSGNISGNAATATNVAWSGITSKPTTLSGFGITDAFPLSGGTITGNSTFSADNYLTFGPNSSWSRYLRIGGNGYTAPVTTMASVVTTNGNLHLDAAKAAGMAIYLNWYGGAGGTIFGNGSGTQVGAVDSSGNTSFIGTLAITGAITGASFSGAGTGLTGTAASLTAGAVTNGIYTTSVIYIGTTAITMSRSSAAQTLTGVSIDGNAANITAYTINQNVGTANSPTFVGLSLTSVSTTGATITNLTGAYQNTTVYDSAKTQSATPSRGIRAPASSIQFTDGYAIAPFYTYRSTGDWPVPYGIGWGTGGESSGIFQRYASNGSSFGDMIFYTGNDGFGAFSFRRHTWEGTAHFAAGSGELNTELFRVDWSGNVSMLGTLNGSANSATLYPNNGPYGSWKIGGTRGGWYGIEFESGTILMANSSESGFYRNGVGWQMWWSGGTGYVQKGGSGGGTQATILESSNYTSYTPGLGTNNTLTGINTINNTSNTVINTLSGNLGLTMFQATAGTDAYMTFHIGSDYAAYFGLGGAENDLVYGGWSAGNNRHRILHSGNATYAWNMNQYVRTTDTCSFAGLTVSNTITGAVSGNAGTVTNGLYTTGGQTIAGITYFSNGESMNVYGIRGRFTNEYLHLYNKVGIGSPNGWGQGETSTPIYGLSTYGGLNIAYGDNGISTFNGVIRANSNIRQGADLARPLSSWSVSGTSTGMVIFSFPGNTGNYGMVHCVFDIYEYNSNTVSTVIVGGHNWNGAWYNTGANVIGRCGKSVRLGVKDSKFCVVFGGAASSWEYGTIILRKIHNGGFYTGIMDMGGSFTTQQTATESFSNIGGDLRALRTSADFIADGGISGTTGTFSGELNIAGNYQIRNANPTITFRDTNNRTGYIHVNGDIFHVLTAVADSGYGSWATVANGRWPMELNLSNNNATFGADVNAISFTGAGTGLTGTAASLNIGGNANNITQYTVNQSVGTANTPTFSELTLSGVGMGAYNLMKYSGLRSGDWQTFTNTQGQLNVIQVNGISSGAHTNYPTGVYTYGAVMSWRTIEHSFQLYAAHTGDLAYKTQWNNDNYSGWRRILDSTNYIHAANMNQYVRTTDTCSFAGLTVSNTINGSVTGNAGSVTNGVYTGTSNTYTGANYFQSNLGTTSGATNTPPLQVYATGTNAAFMSFHRAGNFAVNFGLDSDNVLRIGGWSAAANRLQLDMSGNLTLAGVVDATQFRDSSDTAYYLDPAGTSNLNKLSTFTMAYNDMNPMHIQSPYVARYNASALYRNGTMGYGTVDCNHMFSNWGSGFIDSWSSPANAPGGSTHYVGLQGFHYNHQNNSQAYGFQMLYAGGSANRFFWRSAWPDLLGWVEMIHTGNIASQTVTSCTGTAGSISGFNNPAVAATANTIVYRDGSGHIYGAYILGSYFNASAGNSENPTIGQIWTQNTTDNYLRKSTPAHFRSQVTDGSYPSLTGANASGTWSISVSGNAATATTAVSATSATSATFLNSSNYINRCGSAGNANTDFQNTPAGSVRHNGDDANLTNSPGGTWWFYDNYRHSNSSNYWGTQVAWGWEDQANRLATRNVNAGTFGGWVYYLNSANYNSYSPTLTGTGASGTWSINITGNAATATTATNVTIANGSVTLAKIENITAYTILGNSNASSAATPAALSVATVATMLSGQTMNINGSSTSCSGNAATATNATTVGGLLVQTGTNYEANKIVRTDGNGFVNVGWINTISGDNGTTALNRIYASEDAYLRYYTPANFRAVLDVPTRNGTGVTNFGINTAPSNRLHINGDGTNPTIRIDNAAYVVAATVASNGRGFFGWLPISINVSGTVTTKWIQLYNT